MAVYEWNELEKYFKPGDKIWACSFIFNNDKNHSNLKPTLGVLTTHYKEKYAFKYYIHYFVPCSEKDESKITWGKYRTVYGCKFATTKEEAIELYNNMILDTMAWHDECIKKHEKELIIELEE